MRRGHLSVAGMSIIFALGLAAWEVYFFWYPGSLRNVGWNLGWFTPDRLGFNMAWLAAIYLRVRPELAESGGIVSSEMKDSEYVLDGVCSRNDKSRTDSGTICGLGAASR